ncbi:MAG: 3-phosphoshikimate 1-carboxyvinyltransferase [Dethiobacteria bacterium]|jgi:3-phosphoshikimate 1-carboxyvinyltransferase
MERKNKMEITLAPREQIRGRVKMPGDKSISHRALILSALAEGTVEITGLLAAEDTRATRLCLQQLGVEFQEAGTKLLVRGRGLQGLQEPDDFLQAGNSGTTARLLLGLLAGQPFFSVLTGDSSLRKRPMARVSKPLRQMGARIEGRQEGTLLPLAVRGGNLFPIRYRLPVASAQVKSALLLAGLYTNGRVELFEPGPSRDHTERMLSYLGGSLEKGAPGEIVLAAPCSLAAKKLKIPGDLSSAAFFLVAAALAPRGEILLEAVGVNPTRTGIIDVLQEMGAAVRVLNLKEVCGEPVADLWVQGGRPLRGVVINAPLVPRLVDEIPVLAVAALFAAGETVISGAGELRLKESDRLHALATELQKMGAAIKELPDGLVIQGGQKINGAVCFSHGDHRIAMALAVAALFARGETVIQGIETVDISFPGFFTLLNSLTV